jgi:D-alanyl-D-alanine carboxypeptidase
MPAMNKTVLLSIVALVGLGAIGYLGYQWQTAMHALDATRTELASTTQVAATTKANLEADNQQLADALAAEKQRNDDFEGKIQDISGTVGKLDKLSKIDPELLQKYSKVFFLSENYTPAALAQIPKELSSDDRDKYFQKEALPFLEDMMSAAKEDGINLQVASAYRSFDTQVLLKTSYKVTYGSGANAFSADQGYSEHQLGVTVDFTSSETGGSLSGFDTTKAYAWLTNNAYKYGFALSYPKNNAYYQYEPWHWRFVSEDLAKDLHDDQKYFFELDQRTLDTYLINFFD